MPRVLVADGDHELRSVVELMLSAYGWATLGAGNGNSALLAAMADDFDVIVLNLRLAGVDGFQVLQRLRAEGVDTPVLVLSEHARDLELAAEQGLAADVYMLKPVSELLLRTQLHAMLRRRPPPPNPPEVVRAGELSLHPGIRIVTWRGERVQLGARGFALLRH